jgi:uncharacterized membrane protein YfcA
MADWMTQLTPAQYLLGLGSGGLVGFCLGLIGGGGSILAVPLMVYVVGVPNPHLAIGTSALAVASNAASGLVCHARAGHVRWRCGGLYAGVGILGALLGSSLGKAVDGQKLLALFALVMIAAGFLIVPGLVASTGMPMLNAIGSSLVAVTAFGLTTALSYALSGLVEWPLALIFILGGVMGSYAGMQTSRHLSGSTRALPSLFAGLVFVVAAYVLYRSTSGA